MKKVFLSLATLAMAISSCTNQEVLDVREGTAIGFSTYVGKATRATDMNETTFKEFNVYGSYLLSGTETPVFTGETVTGTVNSGIWTYSPTRYWVEDATYKFAAANDATADYSYTDNSLTFTSYTVENDENDGTKDLVVAFADSPTAQETVNLAFNHVLSKVEFTFTSEFDAQYTVEITDVKINNVYSMGKLSASSSSTTWSEQSDETSYNYDDVTLDMSQATNGVLTADPVTNFLLPQTVGSSVTLTFTIDVDGFPIEETKRDISVTIPTTTITEWVNGLVYNYKLTLNAGNVYELEPIEFEVTTVNNWGNETEGELGIMTSTPVED